MSSASPALTRRPVGLALVALALASALSFADDKPKPGKGTPAGEQYGGEGGEVFRDRADGKLSAIKIRSGLLIDSIACTWTDGAETNEGDRHGGEGGDETAIKLDADEYLIKITGLIYEAEDLKLVGSIKIVTNKRTLGPYGEAEQGKAFEVEAAKGDEICGFRGRCGMFLDAIGIVTRPRP